MENEKNVEIYSTWSKLYDVFFGSKFINSQRKIAIELLGLKLGDNVLLIGIGTGEDLKFVPKGVNVVGVDITEGMLDIARQKSKGLGFGDAEILNMDGENLTMKDNTFDAIILNLILTVVPDGNQCLKEVYRVLKPEGKIVVFDKFLKEEQDINLFRTLLNKVTIKLGTDINRKFSDILKEIKLEIVEDRKSILGGMYRIILLSKRSLNKEIASK